MAKFYQTKEFKELEKEWNKFLEMTGFNDAERIKNGERVLRQNASNAYRQADEFEREAKAKYFQNICHHVNRTIFTNPIDKFVMTMISDGISIKQIVLELALMGHPTHRQTIRFIVRRHEHIWGIRFWSAKDRNLKYG